MRDAWDHVKVPVAGLVGVALITFMAFAAINPHALAYERPAWSITGNAILDERLFDGRINDEGPCALLEDPVCGTDYLTHRNLCEAHKAGADMLYHGACDAE